MSKMQLPQSALTFRITVLHGRFTDSEFRFCTGEELTFDQIIVAAFVALREKNPPVDIDNHEIQVQQISHIGSEEIFLDLN